MEISSWTPLKPQHSSPKPNPLPLKNWCLIHARWSKSSLKHSIHFSGIFSTDSLLSLNLLCYSKKIPYVSVAFFPSLKQNFIAYRSFKVSDCIFEIHQLWQSGFCRVYSNCCCSYSFEPEIIKIGQSSHKMYSNNILNSQESMTILNARTKKVWKLIVCTSYFCRPWGKPEPCKWVKKTSYLAP